MSALPLILDRIRHSGPLTFAQFMEVALYHPEVGYYSSAAQRSGRAGDFYTSVDVGPVFGALLAGQFAEMFEVLDRAAPGSACGTLDLVEAGAGNGRLTRDVLDALEQRHPALYERLRVHLVERSSMARARHLDVVGPHASRLASSSPALPASINGAMFANELLDALAPHVVVAADDGLREVYIDEAGGELVEREGPPSTPALEEYLQAAGAHLEPGWRAEVNLAAVEWMGAASAALERGFLLLIDYGHEASTLYSASHATGTLATFTTHVVEVHDDARQRPWLRDPGTSDITSHVDFTSVRRAAERSGLTPLCRIDQSRFLMSLGIEQHLPEGSGRDALSRRLAMKTLLMPGGLGSTHSVMVFAKGVGSPTLRGCLAKPRF